MECLFCKIANGEIPSATVLENSEFRVILDRFPGSKGHLLIIPKEHVENIFEIDPEKGGRLFALSVQLAKILKKELDLEGLNIVQNNGKIAGQTIFHFHLHLIPRYSDDRINITWKPTEPTEEELDVLAKKLYKALQ
ncbi:MAG: histidine triad family protein [Epulopiscium sp.]|nr:HIT-like protein [Defluviitaleaceae bacterium]MDK2786920.1 histidine triad family protein [Candidatus Epulonipiscium sp.]